VRLGGEIYFSARGPLCPPFLINTMALVAGLDVNLSILWQVAPQTIFALKICQAFFAE